MTRVCETLREYYDLLVKTSKEGGFPAAVFREGDVHCRYRTEDGKKCAVGLVIPDDRYDPTWDCHNLTAYGLPFVVIRPGLPADASVNLLSRIQEVHDELARKCLRGGEFDPDAWDHAEFVRRLGDIPEFAAATTPRPEDDPT